MKYRFFAFFLFISHVITAQFHFTGEVDTDRWQSDVYLSLIEDYRQLNGIYSEQIIARTRTDSLGIFQFNGDQLERTHRLYRLHVDNCMTDDQDVNHFSGSCPDSKSIIFIAKNTDTISFPFGFESEMFCDIKSSNKKAIALMQIDSLKEEMRYAFSEFRSEANRKLNTRKWFNTMQEFGLELNEPLAELYIYSYISTRGSEFYDYYLNDLKSNSYYGELEDRLQTLYPESVYTNQYKTELNADRFSISQQDVAFPWLYILLTAFGISFLLNVALLINRYKSKEKQKASLREKLTQQEKKILELLLTDASNKDIAEQLFVSLSTVKTHVNNIYKKYDIQSRDSLKSLFIK